MDTEKPRTRGEADKLQGCVRSAPAIFKTENYFEQLFATTREACKSIAQSAPEHGTAPSRRLPFPVGGGMPQLCATLGRHTRGWSRTARRRDRPRAGAIAPHRPRRRVSAGARGGMQLRSRTVVDRSRRLDILCLTAQVAAPRGSRPASCRRARVEVFEPISLPSRWCARARPDEGREEC